MRRSAARILIIFIWSVLGTACVLFAAFVFMANVPLTPSLTPAKAAALISGRPEFNRYATLVAVSSTTRGGGRFTQGLLLHGRGHVRAERLEGRDPGVRRISLQ